MKIIINNEIKEHENRGKQSLIKISIKRYFESEPKSSEVLIESIFNTCLTSIYSPFCLKSRSLSHY
jgi:hypothetical protein